MPESSATSSISEAAREFAPAADHRMHTAPDPNYEHRVRDSFSRQPACRLIGASITRVEPGVVEITLPYRDDLTQQHGYVHGGIIGMIADTAGGYAGYTLFPADSSVLTVEYKLNLMAPGEGELFVAVGRVIKPGRTLCVVHGEVHALKDGRQTLCAVMQQTLIVLAGRPDK